MTATSLHEALQRWLPTLPAQVARHLDILPEPPAMLDLRALLDTPSADTAGIALDLAIGDNHLCAWVPVSGVGGAYSAFTEGDDEIGNYHLPAFTDEAGAITTLEARVRDRLLACV